MHLTPKVLIPWTPLYPSQRSGELSLRRALWRGDWRDFIVRWHEERVYFQLSEGEQAVWASLETCAVDETVACFEDAVCERRYGVCFEQCANVFHGRGLLSFRLQFIYAPDGTGLLREWCSRDWIAFAPPETRGWAFFPDLHLPQIGAEESWNCCIYAAKSVREQILFRRANDEEIERLSWRCEINEAEFERAMRLLWDAGLLRGPTSAGYPFAVVSNSAPQLQTEFNLRNLTCDEALKQWLSAYFVGAGFERNPRKWGRRRYRRLRALEPNLRAFFEWDPIRWSVQFHGEPTFHQKLEARLQLRDWLHGKASSSQIERWLA